MIKTFSKPNFCNTRRKMVDRTIECGVESPFPFFMLFIVLLPKLVGGVVAEREEGRRKVVDG